MKRIKRKRLMSPQYKGKKINIIVNKIGNYNPNFQTNCRPHTNYTSPHRQLSSSKSTKRPQTAIKLSKSSKGKIIKSKK